MARGSIGPALGRLGLQSSRGGGTAEV